MAKKNDKTEQDDVRFTIEEAAETTDQTSAKERTDDDKEYLSAQLKQKINQTSESDEAPSASLRLRDVLGGDFLWVLVRRQIWLIILIVVIVTAYVAVRYQCQQDAIDIAQLEKDLVDAKFESLSSSSNLTRMSRQSNIIQLLQQADSVTLHHADQPPYIIDVPEEKK
jgi:preprotein translocase subunit SecF